MPPLPPLKAAMASMSGIDAKASIPSKNESRLIHAVVRGAALPDPIKDDRVGNPEGTLRVVGRGRGGVTNSLFKVGRGVVEVQVGFQG